MPEGKPDDENGAFADKIVELSSNYCGACNVLDRVITRPEASVVCCKFMLRLDTNCDVNVMSKNLCECLLEHSKSLIVVKDNPIPLYTPARRMVMTDVQVAGVTIHEPFVVIENTALITTALGRTASDNLINRLRSYDLLTGPVAATTTVNRNQREIIHTRMKPREDPHPEIDDIQQIVEEIVIQRSQKSWIFCNKRSKKETSSLLRRMRFYLWYEVAELK